MEKLKEEPDANNDSAILKALAIVFTPSGSEINEFGTGYVYKVTTDKLSDVDFRNLVEVSIFYNRSVNIGVKDGKMIIVLTDKADTDEQPG